MSLRKQIPLECHNSVEMTVGGNKLRFLNNGWTVDSSDVTIATTEIMKLSEQNEKLTLTTDMMANEIQILEDTLASERAIKMTVMDMIMEEREKNMITEKELAICKDKLKESYKFIMSMQGYSSSTATITRETTE
jgi:hypothetical protein